MDQLGDVKWSGKLEDYFKDLGERSACLAWLHNRASTYYGSKSMYIDLPVIVLSTLSGSLSLSAASLFGEENEKASQVTCGVLSLGVGILNTINSYFSYSRKSETCRMCFIEYSKLYRFICIELGLPREERLSPKDFLKFTSEQYERLAEVGNCIPQNAINAFKKKFKNAQVSKPECTNGIEPIDVYGRDEVDLVEISIQTNSTTKPVVKNKTKTISTAPVIEKGGKSKVSK